MDYFWVHNFVYFNHIFTVTCSFHFLYRLFIVLVFALFILVIKGTCRRSFPALGGSRVTSELQKLLSENLRIFTRLANFFNQLIDEVVSG